MITPTSVPKNSITPTSPRRGGYATWGDDEVTWGDSIGMWGSPVYTVSSVSKHTITPTSIIKN